MSGISLSHFLEVAHLGTDGEVRMDSSRPGVLINKGMLEHRLGTMLGMGDATTRNDRNAEAVAKFREALTHRFGAEIATKALDFAGYQQGTVLTGRVIVDAHALASRAERDNLINNAHTLRTTTIGDDVEAEVSDAFKTRFAENLKVSTRYFRDELPAHDLEAIKQMTVEQVSVLKFREKIEESDTARKALSDAMQSVLVSIANKEKPDVLLAKLMSARDAQKTLVDIEKEADDHVDRGRLKTQVATFDALEKLDGRYSQFISDMQRRGLADTSSLRALHAGAEEILNKDDATTRQKQEAQALKDQCEALINDVNDATRPHTTSQQGDIARLRDAGTVDAKQQTRATEGLTQVFDQWRADTRDCEAFVNEVLGDRKDDPQQWDKASVSRQLEESVRSSANNRGVPMKEAIRNYRAGIEQDNSLTQGLKDKLFSVLDGMQAEWEMSDALRDNALTQKIRARDAWHLFAPGNEQNGFNASKWDMEQKVRGSYAGMCRGMTEVVRQLGTDRDATGADLGKIHELVIKDNIRCDNQEPLKTGFRDGAFEKNLVVGEDLTADGAIEFRDSVKDDRWFDGSKVSEIKGKTQKDKDYDEELDQADNTGKTIRLSGYADGDDSKLRADEILNSFRDRLIGSHPVDAVASIIQDLHRSHLFNDGDTRSVVTLMTNRLLLSLGQYPTILDDPTKAMGCSVEEFANAIRMGQERAKHELGL